MDDNKAKVLAAVMDAIKSHGLNDTWGITVKPITSTWTGHHYIWMNLTEPRFGENRPLAFPTDMPVDRQPIAQAIHEAVVFLRSVTEKEGANDD